MSNIEQMNYSCASSLTNSPNKRNLQSLNNSFSSESSGIDNGPEFVNLINGLIKDYCCDNDFEEDKNYENKEEINNKLKEEDVSTKAGSPLYSNDIFADGFNNNNYNNNNNLSTVKKSESYSFCSYRNFSRFEKSFENNNNYLNIDNNNKISYFKINNFNNNSNYNNNKNKDLNSKHHYSSSTALNSDKSLKITENLGNNWKSRIGALRDNSFTNLASISKDLQHNEIFNSNQCNFVSSSSYSSCDVNKFNDLKNNNNNTKRKNSFSMMDLVEKDKLTNLNKQKQEEIEKLSNYNNNNNNTYSLSSSNVAVYSSNSNNNKSLFGNGKNNNNNKKAYKSKAIYNKFDTN